MNTNNPRYPKMAVLCRNSEGAPELHTCSPEASAVQIENGDHYELAVENAVDNGYKGPFLAFDETDPAAKQLETVAAWIKPAQQATPVTTAVAAEVAPGSWLNPSQRAIAAAYAGGDFVGLLDLSSEAEYRAALDECGDTLFKFLMIETACAEDCDSATEAVSRLERAIEDIGGALGAVQRAQEWSGCQSS